MSARIALVDDDDALLESIRTDLGDGYDDIGIQQRGTGKDALIFNRSRFVARIGD